MSKTEDVVNFNADILEKEIKRNKKLKKRVRLLEQDLDIAFEAIEALEVKVARNNPFRLIGTTMPGSTPDPRFTINTDTIKTGTEFLNTVHDSVRLVQDFGARLFETKVKNNDEG